MPKRSRLEIYVDILEAVARGVEKPTHIMYKANLSWLSLQEFLTTLIKHGYLTEISLGKRKIYKITDKGIRVLNHFNKIREVLNMNELNL